MSKHILCIVALLILSACNGGSEAPLTNEEPLTVQPQTQILEPAPIVTPSPTPSASPAAIVLQVRSRTETRYPQHLWPTKGYTATGSCVVYLSETYCFDDGMKTPTIPGSTLKYSFWNIDAFGAPTGGGMMADGMTSPRVISPSLTANIATALGVADKVGTVLLFGTPSMVSCVDDHGTLDCGSFSIDTLQVAL